MDTEQKPADVFSRRVSPTQLSKANIWLKGPAFLFEDEEKWPSRKSVPNDDVADDTISVVNANACFNRIEDKKAPTFSGLKESALGGIINRFSDLPRAVRAAGWLLRLKNRLHDRMAGSISQQEDFITAQEYGFTLLALLSLAQRQEYPGLVEMLQLYPYSEVASGRLGKAPKEELRSLDKFCPFVENGVMRIGGRFQRSDKLYNFKHLILLSMDSHLAALIIDHFHRKSGHNGMPYVMKELRERFFVMGQERTVKNTIKPQCMACRNRRARSEIQIMSSCLS